MQSHFLLTDAEMETLEKSGVTIADLFHFAKEYKVSEKDNFVGYVNLFLFVDKNGDFTDVRRKKPEFKIARFLFERYSVKQKIELSEYISDHEDGEF